jgi:hypothetical protein
VNKKSSGPRALHADVLRVFHEVGQVFFWSKLSSRYRVGLPCHRHGLDTFNVAEPVADEPLVEGDPLEHAFVFTTLDGCDGRGPAAGNIAPGEQMLRFELYSCVHNGNYMVRVFENTCYWSTPGAYRYVPLLFLKLCVGAGELYDKKTLLRTTLFLDVYTNSAS